MSRIKKIGPIKVLTVLSILIVLSGMAAVTSADSWYSLPNEFYGTVTLNGADAPVGTVIKAYIDEELRGTIEVTTAGEYGVSDLNYLKVNGNESEDEGKTITFTVDGAAADHSATEWHAYQLPRELDLTVVDSVAPVVTNPDANPTSIVANGTHESLLTATVEDDSDIDFVTVNLSAIGGSAVQTMTRVGTTDVYSVTVTAAEGTAGAHCLQVNASDVFGNYDDTSVCIELTVTGTGRACGDVDTNEGLDARDVSYLAKHVAGISGYDTLYGDGDVDTNEGLDARDVSYLAKHVAGISGYETLHC